MKGSHALQKKAFRLAINVNYSLNDHLKLRIEILNKGIADHVTVLFNGSITAKIEANTSNDHYHLKICYLNGNKPDQVIFLDKKFVASCDFFEIANFLL